MARAATDQLRDLGFDVVYFGNADDFDRTSTVVVDRVGRLDKASAVAAALGTSAVESDPDEELYLDVTVLLGADWDNAPAEEDLDGSPEPWWHLSRWLRDSAADTNESGNED